MQFSFKNVVRLAFFLFCAGGFILSPDASLCMEEGGGVRSKFQSHSSSHQDFFSSLEDKKRSLKDRLSLASDFLQGEEGTLQQRKYICDIFFPFAKRQVEPSENLSFFVAADMIVDHGTPEQRRRLCYDMFRAINDESILLKDRLKAAKILSKGGSLNQRTKALQFLFNTVIDKAIPFEDRIKASRTFFVQGKREQINQVISVLIDILMHQTTDLSLYQKLTIAENILYHESITEEQRECAVEILTVGLERDCSLLRKKDTDGLGFEGTLFFYGNSSQKDRMKKILLSVMRDEKKSFQERIRAANTFLHEHTKYPEDVEAVIEGMIYTFEKTGFCFFSLIDRIDMSKFLMNNVEFRDETKKREISFLLKTAQDKDLSPEIRMKAAGIIVSCRINSSLGEQKDLAETIISSLVKEFLILPPSIYWILNIMSKGTEVKRIALGKSLLSIIENNELSISPVVRIRFLTLFSFPGVLSEHQIRANFLLQSFLQEGESSLFLESSCVVAARTLAKVGDASQKSYGMGFLSSIFESEDASSINLRLEALYAFMENGESVEKEASGKLLFSFLEDKNIRLSEWVVAARTLKQFGTELQKKEMKAFLPDLLQSLEMIPGWSMAIQGILEEPDE